VIRPLAIPLAVGIALIAASAPAAGEGFPVIHNEPITLRILGGKDGQPLGRMHLTLIAGYDRSDMRKQLFREEALTDAHGQLRLSNQLANLPWLQVWVEKKTLCEGNPRIASFSVELMRRDGLSTPNRCGKVAVEDKPGVFNVFVKGKGAAPTPPARASEAAQASSPTGAPASVSPTATSEPAAAACSSSKKARRQPSACGRKLIVLPGLAIYLRQVP
jgi:hypothetical protein